MGILSLFEAVLRLRKTCMLVDYDFDRAYGDVQHEVVSGNHEGKTTEQVIMFVEQRLFTEWARKRYGNDMGEFVLEFVGGPWDGHKWTRQDILRGVSVSDGTTHLGVYGLEVTEEKIWYQWRAGETEPR